MFCIFVQLKVFLLIMLKQIVEKQRTSQVSILSKRTYTKTTYLSSQGTLQQLSSPRPMVAHPPRIE